MLEEQDGSQALSRHLLILHTHWQSTKGPGKSQKSYMEEQDLLLLQVWPLQQQDFLLMVPPTQTFRRNLKALHSDKTAGKSCPRVPLCGSKHDQC